MDGDRRDRRARPLAPLVSATMWLLAALLVAAIGSTGAAAPAGAGLPANRAAVIVDDGATTRAFCVRFDEAWISGIDALERTGLATEMQAYGGLGGAVCKIDGTGCAGGSDCFCDPSKYWAYHRAPKGAAAFSWSGAGAGSTRVANGDVEGWRWGSGSAPAYVSVATACGEAPPPPPPTPPPPPSPTSGAPGPSSTLRPGSMVPPPPVSPPTVTTASTLGGSSGPSTATADGSEATTTEPSDRATTTAPVAVTIVDNGGDDRDGETLADAPRQLPTGDDGGGGSATGALVGFAAVAAVAAGLAFAVRRRASA